MDPLRVPDKLFDEIAELPKAKATRRLQIYAEPVKPELIGRRIAEVKESGSPARWPSPPHAELADAARPSPTCW